MSVAATLDNVLYFLVVEMSQLRSRWLVQLFFFRQLVRAGSTHSCARVFSHVLTSGVSIFGSLVFCCSLQPCLYSFYSHELTRVGSIRSVESLSWIFWNASHDVREWFYSQECQLDMNGFWCGQKPNFNDHDSRFSALVLGFAVRKMTHVFLSCVMS